MDNRASERLPSLPQLLHRIIEAVYDEHTSLPEMADIIGQDAAVATRLITVANSSYFNGAAGQPCHTIERALLVLGIDTVKTVVTTAAIKQFVSSLGGQQRRFMRLFWRRSLTAANFGQVLAGLTRYRMPAEAYLCGLLHQIGQLLLLNRHGQAYLSIWQQADSTASLVALEEEYFHTNHCALGASLIEQWHSAGFLADAVRFQNEAEPAVRDANHLVKIVNLASALSERQTPDDSGYSRADQLFGLGEALTRELASRIADDVARLATSFEIDIDSDSDEDETAHTALGEQIAALGQLGQCTVELWRARSLALLEQAVSRSVAITLGRRHCILFTVTPDRAMLRGSFQTPGRLRTGQQGASDAGDADFVVPLLPGRSIVAEALVQRSPQPMNHDNAAAVIDRQLLRHCQARQLLCLPLLAQGDPVGVLILEPADNDGLSPLIAVLCHELAGAVRHQLDALAAAESSTGGDGNKQWQLKVQEAVHEAGNPLSIIRNYLEMLRARLGDDHAAHGDLALIRDEIDRVGGILLRLRESPPDENVSGDVPLDKLLDDIARLFEQSLFASRGITLARRANAADQMATRPERLKQIVVNLLKNAVEALPEGGIVELTSESPVVINGNAHTVITVRDNGPGIDPLVMQRLFQPVTSTKGGTHAGMGLSIVRRLVDELEGTITCRSGAGGTSFELLLPLATPSSGGRRQ